MAEEEEEKQQEEEDKEERVNTRVNTRMNRPLSSTSTSLIGQSVTGLTLRGFCMLAVECKTHKKHLKSEGCGSTSWKKADTKKTAVWAMNLLIPFLNMGL